MKHLKLFESYINESIDVYHGSTTRFKTFNLSKIGSGDGKSLGGWGIYFSNKKSVADGYYTTGGFVKKYKIEDGPYFDFEDTFYEYDSIIEKLKNKRVKASEIRELKTDYQAYPDTTNKDIYEWLSRVLGSKKKASLFLSDLGYIGNKFADRWDSDAINYVIFHPKYIIREVPMGDEYYESEYESVSFNNSNFIKWFGKSKIKNSDGSPKIMYHGTTYNFDTFKKGNIYLAFEPEYASKYGMTRSFSAFSKSDYKSLEEKSVIPVFVRCENPFDTRNSECEKIFNSKYLYKYGNGTPLSDGLLDWTEAEDFSQFLEDNYPNYDGVYLMDSHNNISLCVFDSNQVKSAIGNNGKYSLKSNKLTENINVGGYEITDKRFNQLYDDSYGCSEDELREYLDILDKYQKEGGVIQRIIFSYKEPKRRKTDHSWTHINNKWEDFVQSLIDFNYDEGKLNGDESVYLMIGETPPNNILIEASLEQFETNYDEQELTIENPLKIKILSIEKVQKLNIYLKTFNESIESDDPYQWGEGHQNTKNFKYRTDFGIMWIPGCRNCNKVVELTFKTPTRRQMIGNCYQSVCFCSECDKPIILDEHKELSIESCLKYPEKYKLLNN